MGEVAVGLSSTEEVGLSSTEGTRTESQIASISGANIFSASSGREDNKNGLLVSTEATVSQGSHLEMGEVEVGLSSTEGTKTESQIASISGANIFSASSGRDDANNVYLISTEATVSPR
jgi:hypothetical protein